MNALLPSTYTELNAIKQLVQEFIPISLDALKNKAELMDRRDNKYVLSNKQVVDFLKRTQTEFDILEIEGLRQFHYLSRYYDTPELQTHLDHNQGRRRRIKIRHRNYVNSGRHYFEVKLKGLRKLTHKYRVSFEPEESISKGLDSKLTRFYIDTLTEHYGADFAQSYLNQLVPSISVGYYRITLVAKAGEERITLDNRIYFTDASQSVSQRHSLNDNKWVVEVKSPTGRTALDRWLFQNINRPVSLCSKYGMGITLLKLPERNTRFKPILRRYFLTDS